MQPWRHFTIWLLSVVLWTAFRPVQAFCGGILHTNHFVSSFHCLSPPDIFFLSCGIACFCIILSHILPSQFLPLSFVASSYCIGFRWRHYPENVVFVVHGNKPPLPSVQNLAMTLIFNFYMVFVTFDEECIYLASVNCLICLSFYIDCDTRQF